MTDLVNLTVHKKAMLEFVASILHDYKLLDKFLHQITDLVFDVQAMTIFHENKCLVTFLKFIDSAYSSNLKFDLTGINQNVRIALVTYLKNTRLVDKTAIYRIMAQCIKNNETLIFSTCFEAANNSKFDIVSVIKNALNKIYKFGKINTDNTDFEKNISSCLEKSRKHLWFPNHIKIIKYMIKKGYSYNTLPVNGEECVLFSDHQCKPCFEQLFDYACRYNNESYVHGLMQNHKKYITSRVIKNQAENAMKIIMTIGAFRQKKNAETEFNKIGGE